jgi:hypothetical protein
LANLPIYHGTAQRGFIKVKGSKEAINIDELDLPPEEAHDDKKKAPPTTWLLHPRHAFTMDGSHFLKNTSAPYGAYSPHSECWYKYVWDEEKRTGVLECHHAGALRWVLLPLTCLNEVKPISKK